MTSTAPASPPARASETELWVDVTTLLNWQRPAVGIIRVEQQFCLWLLAHRPQVQFCRYDKAQRHFHRVSHAEVDARLLRIAAQPNAASPAAATNSPAQGTRLRRLANRLIQRLPPALAPRVRAQLIRRYNQLQHQRLRLASARQRLRRPAGRGGDEASPSASLRLPPGSVYVSLGLDWDYKNMADLYALKQQQGFRCLFFCYDIIPVRLPQLCVADVSRQFAHYFADLAWTADRILCISDASRRDLLALMETLNVPPPDAQRVHLGGDILPAAASRPVSAAIAPLLAEPYLLFVSTIERRKNHEILYRAYARLAEEGLELPRLLFVGMPGWGVNELLSDLRLDPRIQDRIVMLNHVDDAELASLYQHALFTVYPSLYEGWGLPVAESLAFGKYCLCSNSSSLPEVGGEFVDYLDPWDLPAWVERLRFLIQNPAWVAQQNARIARDYRPHPWQATAQEIFDQAMSLHRAPPC